MRVAHGAESDEALLERVAQGDTAAFGQLFDGHSARVAAFVGRRLRDAGLREEVVSDVFLEVWRGASAYRGESPVASWILGIARFRTSCARRFQRQGKRAALVPTAHDALERASGHDAEASVATRDEMRRALHELQALPAGQRAVVALAFFRGHSYEEIATTLGISEASVKTRVRRARMRLRELVGGTA